MLDRAEPEVELAGDFFQEGLIMPGDGAGQMDQVVPAIVLHDVAGKERPEAIAYQPADGRFFYMPEQKGGQACQETVRERLFIDLFQDDSRRQARLRKENLPQSQRQLILQHIPDQPFPQYGTTSLIAQDKAQGKYVLDDLFPVVQAGIGAGPQNAGYAGLVATKGAGSRQQVAADLHRNRQNTPDGAAQHLVLFRERTSSTIKTDRRDRSAVRYPGKQLFPYFSRDLFFRLVKRVDPACLEPAYFLIAVHKAPIRFRGAAVCD